GGGDQGEVARPGDGEEHEDGDNEGAVVSDAEHEGLSLEGGGRGRVYVRGSWGLLLPSSLLLLVLALASASGRGWRLFGWQPWFSRRTLGGRLPEMSPGTAPPSLLLYFAA